jgi:hypothetical protein
LSSVHAVVSSSLLLLVFATCERVRTWISIFGVPVCGGLSVEGRVCGRQLGDVKRTKTATLE